MTMKTSSIQYSSKQTSMRPRRLWIGFIIAVLLVDHQVHTDALQLRNKGKNAINRRYLDEDDDRHGTNPDEENASNGPISGYTWTPSTRPSSIPSLSPSSSPSSSPSVQPSRLPTPTPSDLPSFSPTAFPSDIPSLLPSSSPSAIPSATPTYSPSVSPSSSPTAEPSFIPSSFPSSSPTSVPSLVPTLMPSFSPTSTPSSSPSVSPTNFPSHSPSTTPTSQPSSLPSAMPSLDPCKGYDGVFGNTTDDDTGTIVSYSYGVERNKAVEAATGTTLSDSILDLEGSMLNLLVGSFYSGCSGNPNNRRFLLDEERSRGGTHEYTRDLMVKDLDETTSDNFESHILGLGSAPVDLANGQKCPTSFEKSPGVDPECSLMEGRFTLYLVDRSYEVGMKEAAREYVKSMMNNGLLDDVSPAILGVSFIDDNSRRSIQPRNPILDEDDDLGETETILTIDRNIWYTIGGCVVGLTAIGAVARYRYASQFDDNGDLKGDKVEPDENFTDEVRAATSRDKETSYVYDLSGNKDVGSAVTSRDKETSYVYDLSGNKDVGSAVTSRDKKGRVYVYDLSGNGQ